MGAGVAGGLRIPGAEPAQGPAPATFSGKNSVNSVLWSKKSPTISPLKRGFFEKIGKNL